MPMSPTVLVAYLTLFIAVGFLFVFLSLLVGGFFRTSVPSPQKLEIYECGEPAIERAGGQFDLRFYVVALLFLVFEVEVVFFFPPAIVFGRYFHADSVEETINTPASETMPGDTAHDSSAAAVNKQDAMSLTPYSSRLLTAVTMGDLMVFFGLLLLGFGYVWRCGDLDWVRALRHPLTPAESAAIAAILRRGGY